MPLCADFGVGVDLDVCRRITRRQVGSLASGVDVLLARPDSRRALVADEAELRASYICSSFSR